MTTTSGDETPSRPLLAVGGDVLTAAEVAAAFRVSRATIGKWIKSGVLPVIQHRKGGTLRFRREDVERLLEPRTAEQAS